MLWQVKVRDNNNRLTGHLGLDGSGFLSWFGLGMCDKQVNVILSVKQHVNRIVFVQLCESNDGLIFQVLDDNLLVGIQQFDDAPEQITAVGEWVNGELVVVALRADMDPVTRCSWHWNTTNRHKACLKVLVGVFNSEWKLFITDHLSSFENCQLKGICL